MSTTQGTLQDLARRSRQACIDLVPDDGDQAGNVTEPERRDHPVLGQMCTQGIHQSGALAHQSLPATV